MKYVSSSHGPTLRTMYSRNGGSQVNPCCCVLLLSCSSFSTLTNQQQRPIVSKPHVTNSHIYESKDNVLTTWPTGNGPVVFFPNCPLPISCCGSGMMYSWWSILICNSEKNRGNRELNWVWLEPILSKPHVTNSPNYELKDNLLTTRPTGNGPVLFSKFFFAHFVIVNGVVPS